MRDKHLYLTMGLVVLSVFLLAAGWEFVIEDLIGPLSLANYEQEPLSHRWGYTLVATCFAAIALIIPTLLMKYLNTRLNTQRDSVERALKDSETQMREVTDALPMLIAYLDSEQRYHFVNKTFENWFGVPRGEIVGKSMNDVMTEFVAQADYERFRPHLEKALSGEETKFEETVTYPDGETRNLWAMYIPHFGAGGSIEGVFSLVQDITDRKRMEEALLETKSSLSAIIDNSPNAISLIKTDGRYLLINQAFEKIFGTTSEEIKEKRSTDIFPREIAESGMSHDRAVVESRCPIEREEQFVLEDGTHTFLTTKFPVRDASDNIVLIGAIRNDITRQKEAEAALLDLRRQDELIFSSPDEGVYSLDLEGRTMYCNSTAARMIGREPSQLIGQPPHDILHHTKPDGSPYPREECPINATLRDGEIHHVTDEVFWRKDGSSFPVEYVSIPSREDDSLVGAVVVFRDITGCKPAKEETAA